MTNHGDSNGRAAAVAKPAAVPASAALDDPRVHQAMEEYLQLLQTEQRPDRRAFLARYPADMADALAGCLQGLDFVHAAGAELSHPAAASAHSAAGAAADAVEPAEALGDFRIVREVGRGGMGVVYEAVQVSLGRRVALKVLPFAATMDPRQLQRFHNEARAAASLDHPHIVHVHAVGCEGAVHFYAMQFIDGQTLAALIADLRQRGGRLALPEAQPTTPHVPGQPEPSAETAPLTAAATERTRRDPAHFRRVAELGIQAAEALDHAHALGIVHRDIKPGNLMLDGRGGLWVTDFGLAHIQSDARLTMTGDLVGTLRYMSPEQALAKRVVVDHRTDVYSLGATLYELLTLEPAYRGNDRQELLRQIAFEEPRPPRRINKAIPWELETIVLKAMEKNPAERYATAKELADDLGRFLKDEPIRARPAGVVRRLRKWGRRHPAWLAAAAAALTAAVMVLSGGIGWVANDRATRAQRTTNEIRTALEDSADLQQRRRVPEALAAARRAKAALAGGHADPALGRQVEARVFDLELLSRLEEARLEGAAVKDGHFDDAIGTDRRYGEVFRAFHLDVDAWSAEEAGKHIRDTSVALELAALLDSWAMLRRDRNPQEEARWKHLLDVARAADPDDWRTQLRDALAGKDPEALVRLASSDKALQLLPWTLSAAATLLKITHAMQPAENLLRKAQRQQPDDFWINEGLGHLLREARPPRYDEAIPFLMVAVALRPQSAGAHVNLGIVLSHKGDVDGAIAEFRKAIDLDPKYALAHNNLGAVLYAKGDVDGEIAEFRKAIDLDPKAAMAHDNLGSALRDKGDVDGAIAEYRKAIALDPKYALAHTNLGIALHAKGDLDGAIAELRKAIELDPKLAEAHYNLAAALSHGQGKLAEAEAAYRNVIALKPDYAEAYCNLGQTLSRQGRFAEALAAVKRGHQLGSRKASWPYPSAQWVRDTERRVTLADKLPKFLSGEAQPANTAERLAVAGVCCDSQKFHAAARFYGQAFADQPKLAATCKPLTATAPPAPRPRRAADRATTPSRSTTRNGRVCAGRLSTGCGLT
jgi:serine/threonine protein kinase/Flp pilus assembly protein TadD